MATPPAHRPTPARRSACGFWETLQAGRRLACACGAAQPSGRMECHAVHAWETPCPVRTHAAAMIARQRRGRRGGGTLRCFLLQGRWTFIWSHERTYAPSGPPSIASRPVSRASAGARLAHSHVPAAAAGQRQVPRGGAHVHAGRAQAQRLRHAARQRRLPVRRRLGAPRA